MAGARGAIESALSALDRQARALARGKHRQVRGADEIAALKSLAYSWFESFKPEILGTMTPTELEPVDAAFREVLEATARLSARGKYSGYLKAAKAALVQIRTAAAGRPAGVAPAAPDALPAEAPPAFGALAPDPRMQEILARRWVEIEKCLAGGAALAATVMMGGLLETLFLARINKAQVKKAIFTTRAAPRDKTGKTLPLGEWTLISYIEVSHELKWITKSAKEVGSVLREFRNYIHPHKEMADGVVIDASDAEMFWTLTKTMTKQMLASTTVPPV